MTPRPGHSGDPSDPGHSGDPGDPEDRDPGLARERTSLAWTRTAISFAAVGGAVLKTHLVPGLVIMATAPAIWHLGHLAQRRGDQLKLVTAAIVAVGMLALAVAFWP
jgi:uncharacterized membrane protein YidH (DUF202 family)